MNMPLMSAIQSSESKIVYLTNTPAQDVLQYLAASMDLAPNVHIVLAAPNATRAKALLQELKDIGSWTPIKSNNANQYELENGSTAMSMHVGSDAIRGRNLSFVFINDAAEIKPDALQSFVDTVIPALQNSRTKLIIVRGKTQFERFLPDNAMVTL